MADDRDDFTLTPIDPSSLRPNADADQAAQHRRRTIDVMHRRYGVAPPGVVCGGCASLVRSGGGDGTFPKCRAFRVSCSSATDWRLRWQACGKYTARDVMGPV